jgi:hypothetical protein
MRPFDEAIGSGIVATYANMSNVILLSEVFEGCDEGGTVVGDDFSQGTPSTDEVFEDPIAECLRVFFAKHSKFGVIDKGASTLHNILIASRGWHVHHVDVDFGEERGWGRDGWGNEEISSLSKLADMACLNIPCDVGFHIRPPESKCDECFGSEDHLVADIAVCCSKDVDSSVWGCNDLVCTMRILPPEFSRI